MEWVEDTNGYFWSKQTMDNHKIGYRAIMDNQKNEQIGRVVNYEHASKSKRIESLYA